MKITNADYGIDMVASSDKPKPKWYHWPRFPVLPIFSYRPSNDYNESKFSFSWLNIRVWSMMSPDIGICLEIDDLGGYIKVRIPYINITIWFLWFPLSWHQKTWRTKKCMNQENL